MLYHGLWNICIIHEPLIRDGIFFGYTTPIRMKTTDAPLPSFKNKIPLICSETKCWNRIGCNIQQSNVG